MEIIEWLMNNPEAAGILFALLADLVAGGIPDRVLKYKGVIRWLLKRIIVVLER